MQYAEFVRRLAGGEIAPVYLFHGEEEFVKREMLKRLTAAVVSPEVEALNLHIFDAPSVGEMLAACETMPFLAQRQMVLVRDFPPLRPGEQEGEKGARQQDYQRLAGYLERPAETTCLLVYCQGQVDKRNKFYTLFAQKGCEVFFGTLSDSQIVRWLIKKAKTSGKELSPQDAERMVFQCGRRLETLSGEIDKVIHYSGGQTRILPEHIEEAAVKTVEFTVFQMVDRLCEGRIDEAAGMLRGMFLEGESPVFILSMIARQYHILYMIFLMQSMGKSRDQMRGELALPDFAIRKASGQLKGQTPERLKGALKICLKTDASIKSGALRDDAAAVELAVLKILDQ